MPCVVTVCRKCEHREIIDGSFSLPDVCGREGCGCPYFYYHQIVTPDYILTTEDRAFLIRNCGIAPD